MTRYNLERAILDKLKDKDVFYYRVGSNNKKGIPNIFILNKGQFIAIRVEPKSARFKKLSKQMQECRDLLLKNNAIIIDIKDEKDFDYLNIL